MDDPETRSQKTKAEVQNNAMHDRCPERRDASSKQRKKSGPTAGEKSGPTACEMTTWKSHACKTTRGRTTKRSRNRQSHIRRASDCGDSTSAVLQQDCKLDIPVVVRRRAPMAQTVLGFIDKSCKIPKTVEIPQKHFMPSCDLCEIISAQNTVEVSQVHHIGRIADVSAMM